jgi:hypothetical protein
MSNLRKIGLRILTIWGGISLIGLILIVSYLTYSMTIGNKTENDKATKSDVRFVLNWCELGDDRIENVVRSYTSARSFTGDHVDVYSIKISHISMDELKKTNYGVGHWYRCDTIPEILDGAISLAGRFQDETDWFPKEETLRTKGFYVYPVNIYCNGTSPIGTQLIFINPKDKMVYYIDVKM